MNDQYVSPLSQRYASKEMKYIFSNDKKFSTWRKLWVALARAQKQLGLDISTEQINELESNINNIDYNVAREYESKFRHDVMAHVHTYGDVCPLSKGIIHLGATSCYVGDNTDIILMAEGLKLVKKKLVNAIALLAEFAEKYYDTPTLGFTHFQAAQPTTVGKRATLWIQDLMFDLDECEYVLSNLKLLGCKGTTGTQASFLELFDQDFVKVQELEELITKEMGFESCYEVSGQTYSRKVDAAVLNVLTSVATSAHKFANDIRLLQHLKEIEEPFEKNQIGSSAMAYKRNPMRCERMTSLARYIISAGINPTLTAANQWFERTLDDSANKRISIPESFLATDGVLDLIINVVDGIVVNKSMINKHLNEELPFMITENIMMEEVKAGKDRQEVHERIRTLSMEASYNVKQLGKDNNLLELIAQDDTFGFTIEQLQELSKPEKYIGCADKQVESFLQNKVKPLLIKYQDLLGVNVDINI